MSVTSEKKYKREAKRKKSALTAKPMGGMILGPYKEPLKEVKKGFGYQGALSFDKAGRVQCHICGGCYDELSQHLKLHKINATDYKKKFHLQKSTVLLSERQREKRKMHMMRVFLKLTPEQKRAQRERFAKFRMNRNRAKKILGLELLNKRGICPDQLIALMKKAADEKGYISITSFEKYYKSQRYEEPIKRTFGSWKRAVHAAGLKTRNGGPKTKGYKRIVYTGDQLLDMLKGFHEENGVVPTASDCRRGLLPQLASYTRRFGSLPEARRLAGIKDWQAKLGGPTKRDRLSKLPKEKVSLV